MQKQNKAVLKKIFTIPNILSFFRLCLIPVIVWLYCIKEDHIWTGIVIILSGATDIIDGFIARHFHMVSDLGKILDPIADKFTQLAVLICLVTRFHLMLLPIVCMIIKETFVSITGFLAIQKSGSVPCADWHGKVATLLLYAMMMLHMFWYDIHSNISLLFIILCTVMIEVSAVLYGIANVKAIKQAELEKEKVGNEGKNKK